MAGYLTPKRVVQVIALVLAVAGFVVLALVPTYMSVTTDSTGQETVDAQTIPDVNGLAFLLVLAIPAVLAAIPLLTRGRAGQIASVVSGVLLVVFVVIASLSIGWFFVPAMIAAIVAMLLPSRDRRAARG